MVVIDFDETGKELSVVHDNALMMLVLLTIWSGLVGFATWLHQWQVLVAAMVALFAAIIAVHNTTRSLRLSTKQETIRRERKHAALRAVLPLALAQILDYAERSGRALAQLATQCEQVPLQQLTRDTAPQSSIQQRPPETLKALADFIEYADAVDVVVLEDTVAWMQIHDSRVRRLVERNCDPTQIVTRREIMDSVVDAAMLYAGASSVMQYSRRQIEQLPQIVLWPEANAALIIMGVWTDEYEAIVTRRQGRYPDGIFQRLREAPGV
jgi:hypothetical protein